jgi:histidinol phosphatase-like PHP family hydrolase
MSRDRDMDHATAMIQAAVVMMREDNIEQLKKYLDMGGYLVTLGSDAHKEEHASRRFSEALRALKDLGFQNIYYYKNRIPYPITIERT